MRKSSRKLFKEDLNDVKESFENMNKKSKSAVIAKNEDEEQKLIIDPDSCDEMEYMPYFKPLDVPGIKEDGKLKVGQIPLGLIKYNFKCISGVFRH